MAVSDNRQIPKIIHQIWLGPLEPLEAAMNTWPALHPDWEYKLWTEDNMPSLVNQQAFDDADNYPQKSDILRYELLYNFGGVYVDADEYCIKPLDELIDLVSQSNQTVFAANEGNKELPDLIANGMLGCTKQHPFMSELVGNIGLASLGPAWKVTGPAYLTELIEAKKPEIYLFPSITFYPVHHREKHRRDIKLDVLAENSDIFGVQLWGSTNHAYKPTWYSSPFKYVRYITRKIRHKMFVIQS
jgi:mannosyltransferase OCH1-like enzyme